MHPASWPAPAAELPDPAGSSQGEVTARDSTVIEPSFLPTRRSQGVCLLFTFFGNDGILTVLTGPYTEYSFTIKKKRKKPGLYTL